jgi:hypothetical protein
VSLLLLLQGAGVASDDRTSTATWEQAAATWNATLATPLAAQGVTPRGPHLGAATVAGPAGRRRRRLTMNATFIQRAPSWRAEADVNDDELAIAVLLGVLH